MLTSVNPYRLCCVIGSRELEDKYTKHNSLLSGTTRPLQSLFKVQRLLKKELNKQ